MITDRHFFWGEFVCNYRYRTVLPEEFISITETDLWEFQQKISHWRYRFSLEFEFISITDTEFGLETNLSGEIQKGTGGRGRDRKCHKLSWRLSQIVVTFYDDLWRFMTFYDVLFQWNKETEIVIKCRKLSWHVVNCRDVCRKLSWHFFSRPLPAVPFWFSPIYSVIISATTVIQK